MTRPHTRSASHDPSIPTKHVCHILRLPAELRNMIYEYAFTEHEDLMYVNDIFRTGRLSTNAKRSLARPKERHMQFICRKERSYDHCRQYMKNMVLRSDANQLKFVCRQLYIETKDLEIRYNIIRVESTRNLNAELLCETFLLELPDHLKPRLTTIRIHNLHRLNLYPFWTTPLELTIEDLVMNAVDLALLYPNIQIEYRDLHFSYKAANFVILGIALKIIIHNDLALLDHVSAMIPSVRHAFLQGVDHVRDNIRGLKRAERFQWPSNLRICCHEEDAFDEAKFCLEVMYNAHTWNMVTSVPNGMKIWTDIAKDIHKNGIS